MVSVVVVWQIQDRKRVHWHAQHFVCPSAKRERARESGGRRGSAHRYGRQKDDVFLVSCKSRKARP